MKPLRILSAFSGAGGLDLGFESTGLFSTAICIESNPTYAQTLIKNQNKSFFGHAFLRDARIFSCSVHEFITLEANNLEKYKLDGVIGGPPCQPFSTIGLRQGLSDPRASTLQDFADLVRLAQPTFFLFENVPNLAWQWSGKVLEQIMKNLSLNDSYSISFKIVNAADYGAYTKRKRLIIIGIKRSGHHNSAPFVFPMASHIKKSAQNSVFTLPFWEPVSKVIGDLPPPSKNREQFPTHHVYVTHKPEIVARFQLLRPGEQDKKRKRWRLDPEQPSNSLMAGGDGGFVFHIHPSEPRELTSRECARIQGFSDEFDFNGKPLDVAKQIVNAVPRQLGCAMASGIYRHLENII